MTGSRPFDDHLAVGESSELVGSATLFREPAWTEASICVTDRRILFVPADGGFVDVPREQVLSIRSRPTTRRGNWAIGAQATLVAGIAIALLAAGALLAGTGGGLLALLALLAATGLLATAALAARTAGLLHSDGLLARMWLGMVPGATATRSVGLGSDHISACVDRIDALLASFEALVADTVIDDAVGGADRLGTVDAHRRYERPVGQLVEAWPLAGWFTGSIGLGGVGALLAFGAWIPLGLTLAAVFGVASATAGLEHLRRGDDRGIHRERSVCLYLQGGRTVRFRIDDDASIDRELSRLTVGRPAFQPTERRAAVEEPATDTAVSTER